MNFPSIITQQMKLESVVPAYCTFAINNRLIEYIVDITP